MADVTNSAQFKAQDILIGDRAIGPGRPVYIIAEAGVNHNGDLQLARELIDAARQAGADAVKFQTFEAAELVTADTPKADYQEQNAPGGTQLEMLQRLELPLAAFEELQQYSREQGLTFLATPFSIKTAAFLNEIGVPAIKIGSTDTINLPMLRVAAGFGKPLILSTGMSDMAQIQKAVAALAGSGLKELILLQCTTGYPVALDDVHLRVMAALHAEFGVPVGFSDHTEGCHTAIAAAAMGACMIEKHLTLDTAMSGPDHRASLDPSGFAGLVKAVRETERALGQPAKVIGAGESLIAVTVRKSAAAAADIHAGEILSPEMIIFKRPGTGIPPDRIDDLVGRTVKRDIGRDGLLSWDDISE